jgi:hypothetical protein
MQNNTAEIRRNPNKIPGEAGEGPDYIGEGTLDNEPMRVEAWLVKKEGQETYMSLRFFDARDGLAKAMFVRSEAMG